MLSIEDTLQQMAAFALPLPQVQTRPLLDCLDLVSADDVRAFFDQPSVDSSAMDGYAVATDSAHALGPYTLVGVSAAGDIAGPALLPGQARRILTGAPVPAGTHGVVMQEHAHIQDSQLWLQEPLRNGAYVRTRGSELAKGNVLLAAGDRVRALHIGLLASQGIDRLAVYQSPRVGVISSGNELQDPGKPLSAGQIYDANRAQLLAILRSMGLQTVDLGRVCDDLPSTVAHLRQAADQCDVLISSGGASVGDADFLRAAVAELGHLQHWQVSIKPGKPFAFGHVLGKPFMGLPGNPVSAAVTLLLLGRPWLQRLCGARETQAPWLHMELSQAVDNRDSRPHFLRAVWTKTAHGITVQALAQQSSAALASLSAADCLLEVPAHTRFEIGERVRCYPLQSHSLCA